MKEASKAGLDTKPVEKILKDLRKQSRASLGYYGPRGEDLNKQRIALIEALADLAGQLKGK